MRCKGKSQKNMTQIKIFMNTNKVYGSQEKLENDVNSFLKENDGKITVKDIKYTTTEGNHDSPGWNNWTVMVIYDVK